MTPKGNYGNLATSETPRTEKLLDKEIQVYENKELPTGSDFRHWFNVLHLFNERVEEI